jgi:anti-sigma regulatory factor (Ser/Thr protein kinase)
VHSRNALRATSHSNRLPSARRQAADSAQTATSALHLRLPATTPSAAVLRTALADWLHTTRAAGATIFDLQLACTEVLTITVAPPGHRSALVIEIEATVTDNTVTVTMREFGLCQPPNHTQPTLDQALSLTLIEAMTDSLDIHQHTHGRTFTLQRAI